MNCDNCGCDWLDNGLNPIGCPYCKQNSLRKALSRILEYEAPDWKFREEFGGYVLYDELREEALAALGQEKDK